MIKEDKEILSIYVLGTIFLWLFWPSFNGALAAGNAQYRAIINTYFSMTGSVIATFAFSKLFSKDRKLDMVSLFCVYLCVFNFNFVMYINLLSVLCSLSLLSLCVSAPSLSVSPYYIFLLFVLVGYLPFQVFMHLTALTMIILEAPQYKHSTKQTSMAVV